LSLLREIQDAATGDEVALSVVLRKCRILAQRLGNEEFKSWVDWELNGYPSEAVLPPYRKESAEVRGHFAGPFGRGLRNAPIPSFNVRKEHKWLFQNVFTDGVSRYETLVKAEEGTVQSPWPAEAVAIYSNAFYEGFVCISAWRLVDRSTINGMLNAVRNRVLEFALQIEAEAPDAGEAPSGTVPVKPERAEAIFTNVIYGGNNVIAMAKGDVTQRASVITRPEWKHLSAKLRELGLTEEAVNELSQAIELDSAITPPGEVGPATKRWLGDISARVGMGTLKLVGAASTAVVTAEVLHFLGLH